MKGANNNTYSHSRLTEGKVRKETMRVDEQGVREVRDARRTCEDKRATWRTHELAN